MRPEIGFVYAPALDGLLDDPSVVDVVEFEPQTLWMADRSGCCRAPVAVLDRLHDLVQPVLVHSIGAPVVGSHQVDAAQLDLLGRCGGAGGCSLGLGALELQPYR